MEFMKNYGFQMSIFFWKTFHDFPKFFDKISNKKIKKIKICRIFWHKQINEIENKMSSIIKKIKNEIVNRKVLKKKIFHIWIFFLKELLEFSRNR